MPNKIVLFATAWGSKYGGVNAFNEDLCIALADLLLNKYQVISVVLEASQDEIESAKAKGVELISLAYRGGTDVFEDHLLRDVLFRVTGEGSGDILWWVGHDVFSGPIAIGASKLSGLGSSAVIHHMDYEAYVSFKGASGDVNRAKIERQRDILSRADMVFAVGPKLANSAREKIAGRSKADVVELIPGLAEIEGIDELKKFAAITFGRLDPQNDPIKQTRLAVAAFARAKSAPSDPLGTDASLTIIGLSPDKSDDENRELVELAERIAQRAVNIHGWSYIDDRSALFEHLRSRSVCLMLSLHEGFGLVGWEAIAAEVPLIVSRNSGLYEAIDNLLAGMGTGCITVVDILGSSGDESFQPQDVETVSNALIDVRKRGSKAKQNARLLKRNLKTFCTWRSTASTLAEAWKLEVEENPANIKIARWQPDFLLNALADSHGFVKVASSRQDHFQSIWDKMKPPSTFKKRFILFGGIATALCNQEAAEQYAKWLVINPDSRLYVCYESGPSALARARKLDQSLLDTERGLSANPEERMKMKEQRVLNLKGLILNVISENGQDVSKRIHIIPLKEPLTTYIMIGDDEIYVTPLMEIRSSKTLTFAVATRPPQFRLDVFNFILYHLQTLERAEGIDELVRDLENDISKGGAIC